MEYRAPMKTAVRIALAAGLAFAALALPAAHAQEAAPAKLSAADKAGVARIEAYLNGITTLRAKFLQVSSDGGVAHGTFYLKRPGRLRVEYEPSVPVLIVADGHRLMSYDKELDTLSMLPIDDTLAAFLARPEIRFGRDVVVSQYMREAGLVRVTLVRRDEPGAGSLTLVFDEAPLALRQWSVTDAQGVRTRVALEDPEWGIALDRDLFEMPQTRSGLR